MVPIHRTKENQSLILVHEFHKNLAQFSKTIGRELESRLKKTVYKSIERFLKLFSGPLQVMKKREKKLLDYDNVRGMKDRGETVRRKQKRANIKQHSVPCHFMIPISSNLNNIFALFVFVG